jgi:sigma-B regulation protein RsbU (phosphoserine phosphatase)
MVFFLILTALGGSSYFFLDLYRKDKLASVLQDELSTTSQAANHLASTISLADVISLEKVRASHEIAFLFDDACKRGPGFRGVVSEHFQRNFTDMELDSSNWVETLDLFQACAEETAQGQATPDAKKPVRPVIIIPNKTQIMTPYITALIQGANGSRFAMLSMDGFHTSSANTLFLVDGTGKIIWSADGDEYVEGALNDTGITPDALKQLALEALASPTPKVQFTGTEGLLSYARVGKDWAMMSLSYRPTAMRPVTYATRQALFLVGGFLFLCLFLGKNSAILVTRPLNELKIQAERIGRGDFKTRFEVTGEDEISTVKNAFNAMSDRIFNLIEDTKKTVALEGELEVTKQVQKLLIPKAQVQGMHHNVASYLQNASQCGGDWWGYLEVPRPGRPPVFVVMVGDVTGHGTPSALITATVRGGLSVLSTIIDQNPEIAEDPRQINTYLNRSVFEAARGAITMTFFTAVMDPEKSELRCSNAGHNLPYTITPDAEGKNFRLSVIGRSGVPLGYGMDTKYDTIDTYPWPKGAQLFLYTDGLTECMKGEDNLFDRKSLKKALKAYQELKGRELLQRVLADRAQAIGNLPPGDDVTAVVCEAKGYTADGGNA